MKKNINALLAKLHRVIGSSVIRNVLFSDENDRKYELNKNTYKKEIQNKNR